MISIVKKPWKKTNIKSRFCIMDDGNHKLINGTLPGCWYAKAFVSVNINEYIQQVGIVPHVTCGVILEIILVTASWIHRIVFAQVLANLFFEGCLVELPEANSKSNGIYPGVGGSAKG